MDTTRLRRIWGGMIQRCTNPKKDNFYLYGGRGITVCERWRKFENFAADMGEPPSGVHTLDRYPNGNGNYEPGNVRWATPRQQNRHRRSNRLLTCFGETLTMVEWGERINVSSQGIARRLERGWPLELALTGSPRPGRPRTTFEERRART